MQTQETHKGPVLSYHLSPTEAWDSMLEACENAQKSIYLEEYIFDPDQIGQRFIDVFIAQAQAGITVKLLLDWWGCKSLKRSPQLQQMIDAGVAVQFYREPGVGWFKEGNGFFPRDHRKSLIIDETYAYIGGICIYDRVTDWRDSMLKVNSCIAPQILYIFNQTWRKALGNEETEAQPDDVPHEHYTIYANAPDSNENHFSTWLLKHIDIARQRIRMTTPYFTPDKRLMASLTDALDRGVKLEIILSDYSKSAPYVVGKQYLGELIRRGADIYYYQPSMLHLKTMLIDSQKAAIGSCNLDGLSIYQNQEVMLVSDDTDTVGSLEQHFAMDKAHSKRYSLEDWQARPIYEKMAGRLLSPFKHYL